MKFVDDEDNFDVEGYKHAVEVMFLAQEISVGFASYPTEKITREFTRGSGSSARATRTWAPC